MDAPSTPPASSSRLAEPSSCGRPSAGKDRIQLALAYSLRVQKAPAPPSSTTPVRSSARQLSLPANLLPKAAPTSSASGVHSGADGRAAPRQVQRQHVRSITMEFTLPGDTLPELAVAPLGAAGGAVGPGPGRHDAAGPKRRRVEEFTLPSDNDTPPELGDAMEPSSEVARILATVRYYHRRATSSVELAGKGRSGQATAPPATATAGRAASTGQRALVGKGSTAAPGGAAAATGGMAAAAIAAAAADGITARGGGAPASKRTTSQALQPHRDEHGAAEPPATIQHLMRAVRY